MAGGQWHPKRLILAAARYADGQGPKPRELALAETCRAWGHLPRAGGVLDQPAGLLDRLTAVETVVQAVQAYNAHWKDPEFLETHPEIMRIMTAYWSIEDDNHAG